MTTVLQDLRYGWRMLVKSPGFTTVAGLALALGIGSSTAIFSVVDEVLLHSLPYPHSEQIVSVSDTERSTGALSHDAAPANFLDWAAQNDVFSEVAASRGWQANLTGEDQPERVRVTMASGSFFPLFGVNAMPGRTFGKEQAKPGRANVAVLSHGLWQRRYGSDRGILGRVIAVDGESYTVIGVMPPNFSPDDYGEMWVPSPWDAPSYPLMPDKDPRQFRDRNYLDVWARLKPSVNLQQARVEMDAIAHRLEKQYPDANKDKGIALSPLHEEVVSDIRPILFVLLAAVAFVLLIGCANVANLLMARAATRAREISIRAALGASRARLIRQLLTESVLLALLGGTLGVLLAAWAIPLLLALSPSDLGQFKGISINREVLMVSLVVSVVTAILFGLAPAFYASHSNPNESLREGERGSTLGRSRSRSMLVAAEVALSLILLIGAGLMVKSFSKLTHVDPGFNSDRLLVFEIGLPRSTEEAQQTAFYQQVVARVGALPGVKAAGAVSRLPLAGGNSTRSFQLPGSDKEYGADIRISTPDYFATMGIPLLKGRNFSDHDVNSSVHVAILNEAAARQTFPGEDPIGKYVMHFGNSEKLQIVGVVGNVRHVTLATEARPEIYLPFTQGHWPSMFVAVRSAISDPLALIPAVQGAVWDVDRNVPLFRLRTMNDVIARSVARPKFTMLLLTTFAAIAMVLAAIGLYGVMSYSVSQRTREIGIRLALGAQRRDVLRLVVGQGMALAGAGLIVGIASSIGLTRLIAKLLFGVGATDATTFIGVSLLLAGVALLACWLPARKASGIDPMAALRTE